MAVIETALADSLSREYDFSPTPSLMFEETFGGRENLELLQDALDDWGNEELKDEQTDTTPPRDSAEPQPVLPNEASVPPSGGTSVHAVIPGDTLWQIAHDNNVSLDALIAANPQFAANPDLIFPGQQVNIPNDQQIADGGALTDQAPKLTSNETAKRGEATQVGYLEIPAPKDDPLKESMGLVENNAESIALAQQLSDHATQLNQIGGSGWS
jgi:spore coat assembly protein SafA